MDVSSPPADRGRGVYPPPHLPASAVVVAPSASAGGLGRTSTAPAPRSIRGAVWAGVILGSLLVLGGATIALALHLKGKKETPADAVPAPALAGADLSRSPSAQSSPAAPDDLPLSVRKPTPPTPTPDLPPDLRLPDPDAARANSPARSSLSAEEQARVNAAIDKGAAYLKKHQNASGAWDNGSRVGYAALPGLTLLECGVPASDPVVQKAAAFTRQRCAQLNTTYDLSLAILFFDKLGENQDEARIRSLALRLIAGQRDTGGWNYDCREVLQPREERDLFLLLKEQRPSTPLDLFVPGSEEAPPGLIAESPTRERPDLVTQKPDQPPLGLFLPKAQNVSGSGSTTSVEPGEPRRKPGELSPQAQRTLNTLSPRLRDVPALKTDQGKKTLPKSDPAVTDNSNTQFATLGLWAASRHGVPTERALALIGRRFRVSQLPDGNWRYRFPRVEPFSPAMTGAGLLGLAVGHGLTGSAAPGSGKRLIKDPAIERGLKAFGKHLDADSGRNLYFMWTLERVGMLYSLHKLDGKDWYRWGVEILLKSQKNEGFWFGGGYYGSAPDLDTSFALLFLKRANFTQEISDHLEFFIEGKGMRDQR